MKDYKDLICSLVTPFDEVYSGLAVGIIDGAEEQIYLSGYADEDTKTKITEDTVFEIASVTKVFTALLLADFAVNNKLLLDQPATSALPDNVVLPEDGVSKITFRNLATHTSSLPRLPGNLDETIVDADNPYMAYSIDHLYEFLKSLKSVDKIGATVEYSNLGFGLLGHLMGRIDNSNYFQALATNVLEPLGLADTSIQLSKDQLHRFAQSYIVKGFPVKPWDLQDSMVGAGGLRSTLKDMLKFLRANLDVDATRLKSAILLSHSPNPTPMLKDSIPLRWMSPVILSLFSMLGQWVFDIQPGPPWFALLIFLPVVFAGFCHGTFFALLTTVCVTIGTWLLWGNRFDWLTSLGIGIVFAIFSKQSSRFKKSKQKGSLGWQETQVGNHEVLWHNGMVGGMSSYIAIIPSLKKGVVILTNTGQSVDWLGDELLMELEASETSTNDANYFSRFQGWINKSPFARG